MIVAVALLSALTGLAEGAGVPTSITKEVKCTKDHGKNAAEMQSNYDTCVANKQQQSLFSRHNEKGRFGPQRCRRHRLLFFVFLLLFIFFGDVPS